MSIDSRLHRIVGAQPYPLLFATISGAHVLPLDAVVELAVRDETVQQEMIVPPDPAARRAHHAGARGTQSHL